MPQFIKDPNLPIVQEIPASADLDYTGLKNPINVGQEIVKATASIISNYANKTVAIKRKSAITEAKTAVVEQEHKFALDYMTDPNKFTTAEGRKEINTQYNKLVEDRKKTLSIYRDTMNPSDYKEIEQTYNQATFNTLYSIQSKVNVGHIKQSTDDTMLNLQKIQDSLSIAQNDAQKDDLMNAGLKEIKALGALGIDTKALTYNFIKKSQFNILDSEINKNIVNNLDNELFYMRDKDGTVVKDENGTPIIDNSKKTAALFAAHKDSLSDSAITKSAETLVKYGIPLSEAKEQIKAQREQFWANNMPRMDAKIEKSKEISLNKINKNLVKRDKELFKNTQDMQSKANAPVSDLLNSIYQGDQGDAHEKFLEKDEKGNTILSNMTNGKYLNYEDALKKGKYIKTLKPEHALTIKELSRKENLETMEGITAFSDGLQATAFQTDSESEQTMNLIDIQNTLHDEVLGTNFLIALAGKDGQVTSEEAKNILLDAKTGKDIDITGELLHAPFVERADKKNRNRILYNEIINNPSMYGLNEGSSTVRTVNDITNRYHLNKEFKSQVDDIANKIDRVLIRDHRTTVNFDLDKDSYAYNENTRITKEKFQGEFGLPAETQKEPKNNYVQIANNIVSGSLDFDKIPLNLQNNKEFEDYVADQFVLKYKKKHGDKKPNLEDLEGLPTKFYYNDKINQYLEGDINE